MVEADIDYYRDPLAHTLLEVAINKLTHGLTDPRQVYVLRWMAGRHGGVPNFEPPVLPGVTVWPTRCSSRSNSGI